MHKAAIRMICLIFGLIYLTIEAAYRGYAFFFALFSAQSLSPAEIKAKLFSTFRGKNAGHRK
jgi:hypothetical protein